MEGDVTNAAVCPQGTSPPGRLSWARVLSKLQDRIQERQTEVWWALSEKNQGRGRGQPFTTKRMVFSPRDPEPASSPWVRNTKRTQGRVASPSLRGASAPDVTVSPLSVILTYHTEPRLERPRVHYKPQQEELKQERASPCLSERTPLFEIRRYSQQGVLWWLAGGSASLKPGERSCEPRWGHCKKHRLCPPNTQTPVRAEHSWNRRQGHSIPKAENLLFVPRLVLGCVCSLPELSPAPGPLTPRVLAISESTGLSFKTQLESRHLSSPAPEASAAGSPLPPPHLPPGLPLLPNILPMSEV